MKSYKVLLIICLATTSCLTEQKATNFLRDRGRLSSICAAEFPVKESTATKTTHLPANNSGQRRAIDSAVEAGNDIITRLRADSARAADSISTSCAALIAPYMQQIRDLQLRIRNTKPCVPDTIRTDSVIIRENTAALDSASRYSRKLEAQVYTLDAMLSDANKDASWWQRLALWACGVAAVSWLITLRNPIVSLFKRIFI